MNYPMIGAAAALALFAGMLGAMELGRRLGGRRRARDLEGARVGLGAVEGAVFGLLGLLIAFTFQGAASRFDTRRVLIVEEANAIGTAWTRLDLLPGPAQPALRDLFSRYLDSRLEIYRLLPDLPAVKAAVDRSSALQREIWSAATSACATEGGGAVAVLVLPPLNQMFDIMTTRTMSMVHHQPPIVFVSLFLLVLGCALLAGFGMAGGRERSWSHMIGFAVIMATAIYIIVDLEFPRAGLIRVDAADAVLLGLRDQMK